jgi:hypothetical protein
MQAREMEKSISIPRDWQLLCELAARVATMDGLMTVDVFAVWREHTRKKTAMTAM